ncbi:MAG: GcvT family protein, partial [Hyphomicrobiales bacterium]|nr:GcvT family protein [Hyphomicrobiales bacterium]
MKSHARAVVIGGGVVGASVLYHLAKRGWTDSVLVERAELTSGSTWHAAGGMHTLNGDPNVAKLQQYTIDLYEEIERASGVNVGMHMTGGLNLAGTKERLDWLKMARARGRYLGMDLEILSVDEAAKMYPFVEKEHFVGAMFDPVEGHVDPWGVTNAYAKCATDAGAEIVRRNRVVEIRRAPGGEWDVVTEKGTIRAQHVVNCGGLWAREVGRMVGVELPVLAMEHHYLITEDLPEIIDPKVDRFHVIDFEGEIYMRQEGGGMLIGTYERACVPWQPRETPWDFGQDLLPNDLERIAPSLETAFKHFPKLAKAGIRKVVNGPFTFAPDGNPLVGPVPGVENFWVACAVMAGFSQGGGVGLALSNWMVDGDPGFDVFGMDVARFGAWATRPYVNAKVRENYARRFRIRFPNEELPAARPLRTTAAYDRLVADGAVMGDYCGLENPLWFAPPGVEPREDVTFRRSNAHDHVGAECRAVRSGVGVTETANYGKIEVEGPGATAFLRRALAGRIPPVGRISLAPMLNEIGKLIGDFTVARLGEERYFLVCSLGAETYYLRRFAALKPPPGLALRGASMDWPGFAIAGPKARDLLADLVDADLSSEAFPFLSMREIDVGMIPARVGRISFSGELGYEIWVRPEYQRALHALLLDAGRAHGLVQYGLRALLCLRLEKAFGTWAREYRPIYYPHEAGLDRFLDPKRDDYAGAAAAATARAAGVGHRLRLFEVEASDADAIGDEPLFRDGKVAGWVTSGGYGHTIGRSLAFAYVEAAASGGAAEGYEI